MFAPAHKAPIKTSTPNKISPISSLHLIPIKTNLKTRQRPPPPKIRPLISASTPHKLLAEKKKPMASIPLPASSSNSQNKSSGHSETESAHWQEDELFGHADKSQLGKIEYTCHYAASSSRMSLTQSARNAISQILKSGNSKKKQYPLKNYAKIGNHQLGAMSAPIPYINRETTPSISGHSFHSPPALTTGKLAVREELAALRLPTAVTGLMKPPKQNKTNSYYQCCLIKSKYDPQLAVYTISSTLHQLPYGLPAEC